MSMAFTTEVARQIIGQLIRTYKNHGAVDGVLRAGCPWRCEFCSSSGPILACLRCYRTVHVAWKRRKGRVRVRLSEIAVPRPKAGWPPGCLICCYDCLQLLYHNERRLIDVVLRAAKRGWDKLLCPADHHRWN
jgi:hypothetical protein